MRRFGLIGFPLTHSFSAKYFSEKFSQQQPVTCEYSNYSIDQVTKVRTLFELDQTLVGLNVTIPYKVSVIPQLDSLDTVAAEIGAVNVIKAYRQGGKLRLKGFNTDSPAFAESLPANLTADGGTALVLGSGGASLAVINALTRLKFETIVVSRERRLRGITYSDIDRELYKRTNIIVNATPLGMFPDVDTLPDLDYQLLSPHTLLYDLVYNPPVTRYMAEGIQRGCAVINGMKMLQLQAGKSWDIWNNDSL
jgi:shikimate dehydrogenase